MKVAPMTLFALINILVDKKLITKEELLEYIRKDQMVEKHNS